MVMPSECVPCIECGDTIRHEFLTSCVITWGLSICAFIERQRRTSVDEERGRLFRDMQRQRDEALARVAFLEEELRVERRPASPLLVDE